MRAMSRFPSVDSCLAKFADELCRHDEAHWSMRLSNGIDLEAAVSIENDWITFDAILGDPLPSGWQILARHRQLAGGVRLALDHRGWRARADVPRCLRDLSAVLGSVCSGLRGAAHVATAGSAPVEYLALDELSSMPSMAADMAAVSGWPVTVRPSGAVLVELESDSFVQAEVTCRRGQSAVVAPLVAGDGKPSSVGQQAMALFLLRAASATRMVRPVAMPHGSGWAAALEATLPEASGADAWQAALASLSVVHRLCAREAAALSRGGPAAVAYLEFHGTPVPHGEDGFSRPQI